MVDKTAKAEIVFEPAHVDPGMIIQPKDKAAAPITKPAVEPTAKVDVAMEKYEIIPGSRRLILNIETNGFDPFKNRIIAIGLQDPQKPEQSPTVIMLDDEKYMIKLLFMIIQDGDYNDIVGYGLSFDFRFILIKAMKYNIGCQEFYNCGLIDLMQGVTQGKFEFVYFPQRSPSLSDVAEYFWSFPKMFADAQLLKYYKEGDMEKVREFAVDQIVRIHALYSLFYRITYKKFDPDTLGVLGGSPGSEGLPESPITYGSSGVANESVISKPIPTGTENSLLTIPEVLDVNVLKWKCEKCLSEWTDTQLGTATKCPICGNELVNL